MNVTLLGAAPCACFKFSCTGSCAMYFLNFAVLEALMLLYWWLRHVNVLNLAARGLCRIHVFNVALQRAAPYIFVKFALLETAAYYIFCL